MFDPYHKWMGIPKGQRPPTHYQLLGIAPDERDAEVIKEATLRQTAHVRGYQTGPHADVCTRLLNEIAQARATLLNPKLRQEYDAQLGESAAVPDGAARDTRVMRWPLPWRLDWILAALGYGFLLLLGFLLSARLGYQSRRDPADERNDPVPVMRQEAPAREHSP
jgi:hypothetical protein